MMYPPFFAYVMKSERFETVTVLEGFVTLAYPVGVSLIESEPDELELDELELDELELDELELDEEDDEEPTAVLM